MYNVPCQDSLRALKKYICTRKWLQAAQYRHDRMIESMLKLGFSPCRCLHILINSIKFWNVEKTEDKS